MHKGIAGLEYRQVDVFADAPLQGNGLAVFFDCGQLDGAAMLALTREMRQFESIFLLPGQTPEQWRARLFTVEEELDFAGHPVLGAAAALHERFGGGAEHGWRMELNEKSVSVLTRPENGCYLAEMDQGLAQLSPSLDPQRAELFALAMNADAAQIAPDLPLQVVSTGLPYLILPVRGGLERIRVTRPDLEDLLADVGAKFLYVLDVDALEGRTWDNAGLLEDAATGSAAGPVGAYLAAHGRAEPGQELALRQGRFVHRPSLLHVRVRSEAGGLAVSVSGRVVPVASGRFDATLP